MSSRALSNHVQLILSARVVTSCQSLPRHALHPMKGFNPSEPAILHDRISDTIITWSGEEATVFRSFCVAREDGSVAWKGYVFDGWGNVLGG
jgi:hypothetical protein